MPDDRYLERFGPTVRDLWMLPVCVVFVVVGVFMARGDRPLVGILAVALGGGYMLLWAVVGLRHRLALQVDEHGVTLGTTQPWKSGSAFVPWADIEAVVLWRQRAGRTSVRYVGLLRRPGAPPLPGSVQSPALRSVNAALVPGHLSGDLVADSRPVNFWRLDKQRLAAAIKRFAPHIPFADET